MFKKVISVLLVVFIMLGLASCGNEKDSLKTTSEALEFIRERSKRTTDKLNCIKMQVLIPCL